MEKNLDHWHEFADLINKDKKRALDDFRAHELLSGDLPARGVMPLFNRRPVMRTMITAVAASMLLIAGLILFWTLSGSWHSASTASALEQLFADSLLYNLGGELKAKAPETRPVSSFSPSLSAWGEAAGWNRAAAPVVKPVDPFVTVEHGDPAAVQRKMKKVIQENSIERMLSQFCQLGKEV